MNKSKDGKSIVEKTVDVVKEFAATVSEAAHKAVEPRPATSDGEIIMMPPASTGFMDDAVPQPVVVRKRTRSRTTRAKTIQKGANKTARKNKAESAASRKPVARKTKASTKTKKSSR